MVKSITQLYKSAYTGLSKNSWYLSIVMLINRSGTMVIPFMTIYATQQLHFSIAQAGYIMALFGLGAIAGAYIGGRITDSIGFYPLQVGALLSGGIMFIVLGYLTSFASLCIGTFILSVCNESFRPANSTAIAHYSKPENQTRSYSLNRLAINLGWAVGGALGGFLAGYNYHLLFWVDGCTNISAAILLLLLLPKVQSVTKKTHAQTQVVIASAYKDKVYLFFIALTVLFAICFFQFFSMQTLFYKVKWHFTEQFIGIIMAVNGIIIGFVEMVLVYRLENTKPPTFFIRSGVLLIGVGFVLVNIFPPSHSIALASVTILTFGEMLCLPFMNAVWISRSTPQNRGQYAALYTIAWSTAQIIAPTAGSQLIAHKGFSFLWYSVLGVTVLVAAGFTWLQKTSVRYATR